tara:strand:- start:9 stop:1430 length:1422 start_codon:yes stop_codon:yes gene_type:complete
MPTLTTSRYGFSRPEIGGETDNWGNLLNTNWVNVDAEILRKLDKALVDAQSQTITIANTNSRITTTTTEGFQNVGVGDRIFISGSTASSGANNGIHTVTAVDTTNWLYVDVDTNPLYDDSRTMTWGVVTKMKIDSSPGIDNTPIGANTNSSGKFTTLEATSTGTIAGNTTIGGTLGVTGASTLTGNTAVSGTLGVTGATTLSGGVTVTGNSSVSGDSTVSGSQTVSTNQTVTGNQTVNGNTTLGNANSDTVTVNAKVGATTFDGQVTSEVEDGIAPFVVASTTKVANLNADSLDGQTAPSGTIVGTSDTQELTNKTITNSNNTIHADQWKNGRKIILAGDCSGEVTIDGSQNETLTVTVGGLVKFKGTGKVSGTPASGKTWIAYGHATYTNEQAGEYTSRSDLGEVIWDGSSAAVTVPMTNDSVGLNSGFNRYGTAGYGYGDVVSINTGSGYSDNVPSGATATWAYTLEFDDA